MHLFCLLGVDNLAVIIGPTIAGIIIIIITILAVLIVIIVVKCWWHHRKHPSTREFYPELVSTVTVAKCV